MTDVSDSASQMPTYPACDGCGAPPADRQHGCPECFDWKCGTQKLCSTGDLALPAGVYRSEACVQIDQGGGWDAG